MKEKFKNPTHGQQLLWNEMTPEEKKEWYDLHTYQFNIGPEAKWDEEAELAYMTPARRAEWEAMSDGQHEYWIAMAEYDLAKIIHRSKIGDLQGKVRKRIEEKTGKKYSLLLIHEDGMLRGEEVLEQ